MKTPVTFLAVIFISLIAIGHALRVITGVDLIVAGIQAPMWASVVAAVFCAVLAFLLYKERGS